MSTPVLPTDRAPLSGPEKFVTLIIVVVPFLAVASIPLLWGYMKVMPAIWMLLAFYILTVQAITVSFHRELTHGSIRLKPLARYLEAALAHMSFEGEYRDWCTDHRIHHAKTDKEGDPHSPMEGFLHSHFGWFLDKGKPNYKRWIPDLLRDRGLAVIGKWWLAIAGLGLVLPGFLTLLFEPTLRGFLAGVFWGGLVRVFMVHHVTWSINSVCHLWGTRPFRSKDQSTNNFVFGILGGGEGWHRNHHAFPQSARIGLRWWELDWGWMAIRILDLFGLVEELNVPTKEQIEAKLV